MFSQKEKKHLLPVYSGPNMASGVITHFISLSL